MKLPAALDAARTAGTLRDVDYYLAQHLVALDPAPTPELALAIAAVSRAAGNGDVCLDLGNGAALFAGDDGRHAGIPPPPTDAWRRMLRASVLVGDATTQPARPLVLDAQDRLYLQKYFAFEQAVVADVRTRIAMAPAVDERALSAVLDRFFPGRPVDDTQRQAAATAARSAFAVITGGPGTGKTTTVTRLLAVLLALAPRGLRIALAAPTGKAAARLGDAIRAAVQALRAEGADAALLARIPLEASTLHRLLGFLPGGEPRHRADNPLATDLLVVDEASMIDQPLMARLLAAVPATARVVLLGDRDQLASVEAGSVLGDLCNRGEPPPARTRMAGHIAVLTHSHRFAAGSGIGALARAINAGDAAGAGTVLAQEGDVRLREVAASAFATAIAEQARQAFAAIPATGDPHAAIRRHEAFRFLCALREGPHGVVALNRLVVQALTRAGLIDAHDRHYAGRPLLVTENDHGLRLFNGDTGLVLRDPGDGVLRAFFLQGDGALRRVALNRLPAHETCYAMTVHKSQGSEFDRVVLVLPDTDSPLLTRELVYTGVTRAKAAVEIWSSRAVLATAIGRRIARSSGLRDALWTSPPPA